MITVLTLFVILLFLLQVGFGVLAFFAWKKIELFLTWNTRYTASSYEQAVTATGKPPKPSLPAKKLDIRGREVKQTDDLIDITEVDFETGYDAIAKMGES